MKTEHVYKGYPIELDKDGEFKTNDKESTNYIRSDTLKGLKKKIDAIAKSKIDRTPAFLYTNGEWRKGVVTSIREKDAYFNRKSYRAFFTYEKDGHKIKTQSDVERLVKITQKNQVIIKQINGVTAEIEKLETKKEELEKELEHHELKDFGYKSD